MLGSQRAPKSWQSETTPDRQKPRAICGFTPVIVFYLVLVISFMYRKSFSTHRHMEIEWYVCADYWKIMLKAYGT